MKIATKRVTLNAGWKFYYEDYKDDGVKASDTPHCPRAR